MDNVNLDYVLHGARFNLCPRCQTQVEKGKKGWNCPKCGHHSKNYIPLRYRCFMCKTDIYVEDDPPCYAPTHLFLFNEATDRRVFTTAPNTFCGKCFTIWTTEMDNMRIKFEQPNFPHGKFEFHLVKKRNDKNYVPKILKAKPKHDI